MLGPGDFMRLPADTAEAVRRVVRELVVVRVLLERAVNNLEDEFDHLNKEVAHLKRRVDEIADTMPTANDGGALSKVKDVLTGSNDSQR